MYVPSAYEANDPAVLFELIRRFPLGTLVTNAGGDLEANHVPFIAVHNQGPAFLLAHLARNNPDWPRLANGDRVLVVFRGEQGYVSPNWYPSKQRSEDQVPTWNYQVVHVHGRVTVVDDPKFARGVVARLVTHHEATQAHPWKITDSTPEYITGELTHIVGLRIDIDLLQGKFKLSQNRDEADRRGAVHGLREAGNPGLAHAMDLPEGPPQT